MLCDVSRRRRMAWAVPVCWFCVASHSLADLGGRPHGPAMAHGQTRVSRAHRSPPRSIQPHRWQYLDGVPLRPPVPPARGVAAPLRWPVGVRRGGSNGHHVQVSLCLATAGSRHGQENALMLNDPVLKILRAAVRWKIGIPNVWRGGGHFPPLWNTMRPKAA